MFNRFYAWATALIAESKNDEGQTFVEYALILAFVVIVALVGYKLLGTNIAAKVNEVAGQL